MKYTCCNYEMEKLGDFRDYDLKIKLFWCHQCGRVVQASSSGDLTMNKTFTPVDAYKGIGRECL